MFGVLAARRDCCRHIAKKKNLKSTGSTMSNRGKAGGGKGPPTKHAPAPAPVAKGNSGGGGKRGSAADSDEAAPKKPKKSGNDARAEALEEVRGMNEAVADNNGDDNSITPPASPDRFS